MDLKNVKNIISFCSFSLALVVSSPIFGACGTCPPGAQGPSGPQGPAGTQGTQGSQGTQGIQGVQGPRGLSGAAGAKGEAGPAAEFCGILSFCDPYSLVNQSKTSLSSILLENNILSTPDIDSLNSGITGEIIVNTAGTYVILYSATAKVESCYDNWSVGVCLDGVLIAGSVKAASNKIDFETVTGHVIVPIQAGQAVTLCNTSNHSLELLSNVSGGSMPNTAAALDLFMLTSGTTF